MKTTMDLPEDRDKKYISNPNYIWVGYPEIHELDRFVIEEGKLTYLYVSLEVAARWSMNPTDDRVLEIKFHPTEEDDRRLAPRKEKKLKEAQLSLQCWDHKWIQEKSDEHRERDPLGPETVTGDPKGH